MVEKTDLEELRQKASTLYNTLLQAQAFDNEKGWRRVEKRIHRNAIRSHFSTLALKTAAILSIPLLITTIALAWMNYNLHVHRSTSAMLSATSAPGVVTKLILPDSSIVWLNSSSRLSYPASFDSKVRRVQLSGEGFFQVNSDLSHPFIVALEHGLEVSAHGTRFGISSYEQDIEVLATLEKGAINVKNANGAIFELKPHEQIRYNKGTRQFKIQTIDPHEFTAWKNGQLIFRDQPLDEVLRQLSHRYNVTFIVSNPHHRTYRFRATFQDETLPQVLNNMRLVAPFSWATETTGNRQGNTFIRQRIQIKIK